MELPSHVQLNFFLGNQCIRLESGNLSHDFVNSTSKSNIFEISNTQSIERNSRNRLAVFSNLDPLKCSFCNQSHALYYCSLFLPKYSFKHFNWCKDKGLYFN